MKNALIVSLVMMAVLLATSVSAAYSCTNAWTYNNGTDDLNVSAGNVCVNETDYDVNPTAAVHCNVTAQTWSDCVADACSLDEYYVGYAGDGTETCVDTDWQLMGTSDVPSGQRVVTTEHAALCNYSASGGTPGVAAYASCTNLYTRNGTQTTGYCDGSGGNQTQVVTVRVTDGNVCVAGANADPNATYKCGTWSDCVEGASTADEYYVGYAGSGALCSDTDWKTAGTQQTAPSGQRWSTTVHTDSCSAVGYAYSYTQDDFQNIVVDGMGTAGAELVSMLDLIIICLVLLVGVGIMVKYGNLFK